LQKKKTYKNVNNIFIVKIYNFWDIRPCSSLKANRCFGWILRVHIQVWKLSQARNHFIMVPCLAYSPTLKVEASCSFKNSVDFRQITWRYITKDRTLHNHLFENFKSYKSSSYLSVRLSSYKISRSTECYFIKYDIV
jgi:hypothetical protein